jgi:hypothetical protein
MWGVRADLPFIQWYDVESGLGWTIFPLILGLYDGF